MMDLAFFRLPNGQAWIGEGPFAEAAAPPDGAAFYVNDFTLSDVRPWKIPARLIPVNNADLLEPYLTGAVRPRITWQKPATEWFKMAFRRIRKDVLSHRLRKMVPVLTETGSLAEGDMRHLLKTVLHAPEGLWAYSFLKGSDGFLGATPEMLLTLKGRHLETMALAGTAKPGASEDFLIDAKEIDEHEIVASFVQEALQPLGPVARAPRIPSQAGGLTHFRTSLSVELSDEGNLNDLVARLHPTPAVGCLPRDEASMAKLMEYRRQLQAPAFFGAPFGFKNGADFHCVVAIRGIGWEGGKVALPSGCGIVSGSAFDHEWRELRLKREAVARLLGVL
jgi:menaquinone-specific isochorismate synthase